MNLEELDPRFELKLPLRGAGAREARALLRCHPLRFEVLYPDRAIHSLYFDTPELHALHDAVDGAHERLKLRLRWYGRAGGARRGQLEWKWRRGRIGFKRTLELAWGGPIERLGLRELRARLRDAIPSSQWRAFDALAVPTLLCSYERSYFVSRDGRCRVTRDRSLAFSPQLGDALRLHPDVRPADLEIIELKVAADQPQAARAALAGFRRRSARFSKYVAGMRLHPWAA